MAEVIHEKLAPPSRLTPADEKSSEKAERAHAPDTPHSGCQHALTKKPRTQARKIFLQAVRGEDTIKGGKIRESVDYQGED